MTIFLYVIPNSNFFLPLGKNLKNVLKTESFKAYTMCIMCIYVITSMMVVVIPCTQQNL